MNIKVYASKVNRDCLTKNELKELDFAFLQEKFYEQSTNKDLFTLTLSEQGFWYHRTSCEAKEEKQALCSFNVSPEIAIIPERAKTTTRPRIDKEKLYPTFFAHEHSRKEEVLALQKSLKVFTSRWKLFFKKRNGVTTSFWGMAKGTPSYNEFMRRRIIDTAQILANESAQCLIATPTVKSLEDGRSRIKQWQHFAERLSKLEKGLKKRFDIKMIVALESTKKMNPHAHIQIFLPFKFNDFKWRYSRSGKHKYICGGALREAITELWGEEIVDLQECRPESVKWYLSKYCSKNMSLDCLSMVEKESVSKDDIKEIATILMPVLANIRQFRLPRLSKKQKESLQKKNVIQSCSPKPAYPLKNSSPTLTERVLKTNGEAVVLDCLRNNSPLPCLSRFYEGNFNELKKEIGEDLDKWNEKPEEEKEKALCKCRCKSCSGCAFSLWAKQFLFGGADCNKNVDILSTFGGDFPKSTFNKADKAMRDKTEAKIFADYDGQKQFMFELMPNDWSVEEKRDVFLTVEKLAVPLWQFVLIDKYAKWATDVNMHKESVDFDSYKKCKIGIDYIR